MNRSAPAALSSPEPVLVRSASPALGVHLLPERLPRFAPWGRHGAQPEVRRQGPGPGVVSVGAPGVRVLGVTGAVGLHVEVSQGGILPTQGRGPPTPGGVVPLELLDDGGELGVQRRPSRL